MNDERLDGFVPGNHVIEAYGNGGFRFAGMSHKGSVIVMSTGVHAFKATLPSEITAATLGPVFEAEAGSIELLLVGTGVDLVPLGSALRERLKAAGLRSDPMATGAAARTYNVLMAEGRRVAAALLAVA